jgi:hypothetical protein
MKIKSIIFFTAFFTIAISSCYYDVEEELYPTTTACDTTKISFKTTIYPIFQSNCNLSGCHNAASASAGVNLEGYANVKANIDLPKLLGSIRFDSKYSAMPKNSGQLKACDIQKIDQWRKNGSPDN